MVVREKVPEVPYRTTLDEFILTSLGIMTLQVLSSTAVMGIGHRYWGTTIAGVPACPMVAPAGHRENVTSAWWSSAAGAAAKVENATAAGGACETAAETTTRAQLVDRAFLILCLVYYVVSTLRFAYFAFAWRRHVDAALSTTWTWLRSTATFQHDSFEPLLATPCAGFRREYDGVHGGGRHTPWAFRYVQFEATRVCI